VYKKKKEHQIGVPSRSIKPVPNFSRLRWKKAPDHISPRKFT